MKTLPGLIEKLARIAVVRIEHEKRRALNTEKRLKSALRACDLWEEGHRIDLDKQKEAEKELAFLRRWKEINERQNKIRRQLLAIEKDDTRKLADTNKALREELNVMRSRIVFALKFVPKGSNPDGFTFPDGHKEPCGEWTDYDKDMVEFWRGAIKSWHELFEEDGVSIPAEEWHRYVERMRRLGKATGNRLDLWTGERR